MNYDSFWTLAELKSITGISDVMVSRLRGEREPIKKFNINLLQKRINHNGIKVVNDYDIKLIALYKLYSSMFTSQGKPKQMKEAIEELNFMLQQKNLEDIIDFLKDISETRNMYLDLLKNSQGTQVFDVVKFIQKNTKSNISF